MDESTERSVVLKNVSEETSGIFKCEVMGEGPSFRTAVETKAMNVVGEWRRDAMEPMRLQECEEWRGQGHDFICHNNRRLLTHKYINK